MLAAVYSGFPPPPPAAAAAFEPGDAAGMRAAVYSGLQPAAAAAAAAFGPGDAAGMLAAVPVSQHKFRACGLFHGNDAKASGLSDRIKAKTPPGTRRLGWPAPSPIVSPADRPPPHPAVLPPPMPARSRRALPHPPHDASLLPGPSHRCWPRLRLACDPAPAMAATTDHELVLCRLNDSDRPATSPPRCARGVRTSRGPIRPEIPSSATQISRCVTPEISTHATCTKKTRSRIFAREMSSRAALAKKL